ncbi:MAG: hypothetical protein KGK18_09950 [Burkholderiales bacterium]|nr:hypothetical protein [Burkholderiales bacterium]
MPDLRLTDVESTNLHMLCAIRLGIEQDRVTASSKFALSAALAERLLGLNHDQLWSIVTHVGSTTLFPPREDLLALLQAPVPLTGPLAAVHAARPPKN